MKKATIDEYQRGALTAISVLICTHDDLVAAADVLVEMGMAEINLADLDQWDKDNLRKLQGERGGAIKLRNLGKKFK